MKPSSMKATALALLSLHLASGQECGPSSSVDFDYEITPTEGFDIRWSLDEVAETISFEVVYDSAAWVSVGFPSVELEMVGADAVIGLPGDASVMEYDMTGQSVAAVNPFADQEITDGSVAQDGESGTTTLTFTRPLTPDGSKQVLSSTPGDLTSIIYAFGTGNDLAWHGPEPNRSGFVVDLFCGDTEAGGGAGTATPAATLAPSEAEMAQSASPSSAFAATPTPSGVEMVEPISASAAPTAVATMLDETSSPTTIPTSLEEGQTMSPTAAVMETPAPTRAQRDVDLGGDTGTAAPTVVTTRVPVPDDETVAPSAPEDGADQGDTDAASVVGSRDGWAAAMVMAGVTAALFTMPML